MENKHPNLYTEINNRISVVRDLLLNDLTFDTSQIARLAESIHEAFLNGKKVAFVGNGGSAAEAMHLAAEFTGKCVTDHAPLPVFCLNESQSALTAIANDYGIDFMFSRQVEAHLQEGDYLIALSTSGKSKNIVKALEVASAKGVIPIIWMGDFDFHVNGVEVWKVPSKQTPRIQEVHLCWGHILAEIIEIL
jgi:D-sedoheptulose 7-phosphate isomerase